MMRLLETMNIIATGIHQSKYYLQKYCFKHYNLLPKGPLQVFMKNSKIFTNKSP